MPTRVFALFALMGVLIFLPACDGNSSPASAKALSTAVLSVHDDVYDNRPAEVRAEAYCKLLKSDPILTDILNRVEVKRSKWCQPLLVNDPIIGVDQVYNDINAAVLKLRKMIAAESSSSALIEVSIVSGCSKKDARIILDNVVNVLLTESFARRDRANIALRQTYQQTKIDLKQEENLVMGQLQKLREENAATILVEAEARLAGWAGQQIDLERANRSIQLHIDALTESGGNQEKIKKLQDEMKRGEAMKAWLEEQIGLARAQYFKATGTQNTIEKAEHWLAACRQRIAAAENDLVELRKAAADPRSPLQLMTPPSK